MLRAWGRLAGIARMDPPHGNRVGYLDQARERKAIHDPILICSCWCRGVTERAGAILGPRFGLVNPMDASYLRVG